MNSFSKLQGMPTQPEDDVHLPFVIWGTDHLPSDERLGSGIDLWSLYDRRRLQQIPQLETLFCFIVAEMGDRILLEGSNKLKKQPAADSHGHNPCQQHCHLYIKHRPLSQPQVQEEPQNLFMNQRR